MFFKASLSKRERRKTSGQRKIVSRDGLTFYFSLYSNSKIIYSNHVEIWTLLKCTKSVIITHKPASQKWSLGSGLWCSTESPRIPPTISAAPLLGPVWLCFSPPAPVTLSEGLPSGSCSCFARVCREGEVAGQTICEGVEHAVRHKLHSWASLWEETAATLNYPETAFWLGFLPIPILLPPPWPGSPGSTSVVNHLHTNLHLRVCF